MTSPENEAYKAFEKKFEEFCEEQNNIRRLQSFNQICEYLISTTDLNNIPIRIWQKCTEFTVQNVSSSEQFLCFISILNKAKENITFDKFSDSILRLFENAFLLSEDDSAVISQSLSFFNFILQNKKISSDLSTTGIFESIYGTVFSKGKNVKTAQLLQQIIFENCNQSFFESITSKQLSKVFEALTSTNNNHEFKQVIIIFILDFYEKVIRVNPKNSDILKKDNNIQSFVKFIDEFSDDDKQIFLVKLINSGETPSQDIISQLVPPNTKPQPYMSRAIISTAEKYPQEIQKLQGIIPFSTWCDTDINAEEILRLISILQKVDHTLISQIMPHLINHLKPDTPVSLFIQTFVLIDNQLLRRLISLSDLLKANFLQAFVIDAPEEYIIEFFKKSATFVQLILDVFSICKDLTLHEKVTDKIFTLSKHKDILNMLSTAISGFICVWPTSNSVKKIMNIIDETQTGELSEGLISSCTKSFTVANLFVQEGGIQWTLDNYYQLSMSIKQLSFLLAAIASHDLYKELDQTIQKLPSDHPLFQIPSELVEPIVFGMKNLTFYREIRVSSMFHLLPDKNVTDPYNLWKIGNFCFDKLSEDDKHKLLPLVANRFLLPSQVESIIKTAPKIDACCNPSFDHFPLFQFYPGQGELTIETDYLMCSFWFKLGDFINFEMTLFRNELMTITIRDTTLTCEVEKQKCHAEITPVEWNLIVVRLEVGMINSSLHVNTKTDELIFQPKKKVTILKKAVFGSTNQTIVLLGSSVRFSKNWISDFSVLESRGPGSMKPIEGIKESLQITALNVDKNILPNNCYNVHYFGLPRHLHNALHQQSLFKLLNDNEKSENAIIAIANTAVITQGALKHFIDRALTAIKDYQPKVTSEVMKKQLITILSCTDTPKEELFMSLFTDMELWNKIDNFTLLSTLFDLFPNVIYKNIDSGELFISERIFKNPEDKRLLALVLNNFKRLPKTFKYVVNLLKSSPLVKDLNWEVLKNRKSDTLQLTICQVLGDFISKDNVDYLANYLLFDDLKYLMISSENTLAANIYHLICQITYFIPNYMIIDFVFLTNISRLTSFSIVWEDTIKLCQRDQQRTVKNISVVPILLNLTWSTAVAIFHARNHKCEKENMKLIEIESYMNNALALLMDIVPKILETPICLSLLLYFYPLILNYPYVYFAEKDESDRPLPINHESMNFQTMSEYNDILWSNLEIPKEIQFQKPQIPFTPIEFLKNLVDEILISFDLPQEVTEEFNGQIPEIGSWMKTSPLFIFMSDLLLNCSPSNFTLLARSFFIGTPFRYPKKPRHYTHSLLHILMSCMTVPLSSNIPFQKLFSFIHFLCGLNLLSDNAQLFISDILLLSSSIFWTFGDAAILKYADQINPILLQLMATSPEKQYEQIFGLIQKNSKILNLICTQTKSHQVWLFFLSNFMNKETEAKQLFGITEDYEKNMLQDSWGQFTSQFQKTFEEITKEIKSFKQSHFVDFGFISRETVKYTFISNCKSFVIGTMMKQCYEYNNCVFTMLCDLRKWEVFRFRLMEKMRQATNENPVNLFMSLKSLPYFPPKLLPPVADNPGFESFHKKHFIHRNSCLSIFQRTFEKFGNPIQITSCVFIRYGDAIPSILFTYNKSLVIVLFSTFKDNQMIMYDEHSTIFEESLLAGQIGKLYLFDNHFVIEVKSNDLLAIHCNKNKMNIWSFSYGNFLLVFENEIQGNLLHYANKLDDDVTKSFLFDHLLDQIKTKEEATKRWSNRSISSFQYVCILNALCGFSFSDIDNFPCFPPFLDPPEEDPGQQTPFPSGCMVSMSLSRILPFKKLPKTEINSNSLIACSYSLAEKTMEEDTNHDIFRSMRLRDALESENARVELQQWTRVHFTTRPIRTNSLEVPGKIKLSEARKTPSQANLPPLSGRTSVLKSAFICIYPEDIKLEIFDINTGKVYVRYIDHAFNQALSVSSSQNGLFIVVDFSFGETRAYRVNYENDLPSGLMVLNSFPSPCKPRSCVSGSNWLSATCFENKVVLWDIFNGLVHRTIIFESKVFSSLFDVPQSHIWVLCEDNCIYCYTVNATFLCKLSLGERNYSDMNFISTSYCTVFAEDKKMNEVVSFYVSSHKKCVKMRTVGDVDKQSIMQAALEQFKLKKILCGDALNTNQYHIMVKKKRRASYDHCAICNSPAKGVCRICNKYVCEQCLTMDNLGPVCKNCIELL